MFFTHKNLLFALVLACMSAFVPTLSAQEAAATGEDFELLIAKIDSLQWQTGRIAIGDNLATMQTPPGFRFLGSADAKFILTDLWGNPKETSDDALGMLFPETDGPLSDSTIGFVISFEKMGFVKDDDAADMNFTEIMDGMKADNAESNKQRQELGYGTADVVGWASEPYYDSAKKTLHWAKELHFGDSETNTLNYDARVLGRHGVLSINAVGNISDLPRAKAMIPALLDATAFTDGNRYQDFDSNIDEVAAWTVGGLVAGKVLAKAGFFAVILKFIKPIVIGLGLAGSAIWKFVTGRRRKDEEADQPEMTEEVK